MTDIDGSGCTQGSTFMPCQDSTVLQCSAPWETLWESEAPSSCEEFAIQPVFILQ